MINPIALRINQASVVMEDTGLPEIQVMLRIAAEEIQRLHDALEKIRFAGNAANPQAIWMQKLAAHAMDPKWPNPGEQP